MLLAIDIGNSSIKFGAYHGEELRKHFQIPTDREYSVETLRSAVGNSIDFQIDRAIVCSVVPEVNSVVKDLIRDDHRCETQFVANDWDLGLTINYQPLSAAGTDRLVNCFSAAEKYGVPVIVCSLGTALTIDVVDDKRVLLGGLIAPGIRPLTAALKLATSQLPEVELARPEKVIQNTTNGAIRSGVVNGYLAMFEGLLKLTIRELRHQPLVVATGGSAAFIDQHTEFIDVVDRNLTLEGLRKIAERGRT